MKFHVENECEEMSDEKIVVKKISNRITMLFGGWFLDGRRNQFRGPSGNPPQTA